MSESLFGLAGNDYWEDPWKNAPALHEKHVMGRQYGMFIDAPASVNPLYNTTIPMPFYYVAQQREGWNIDLASMAKVVASRKEDRSFFIDDAIAPKDNSLPRPKVGKDSTAPMSEMNTVDLQAQLRILDKPGNYRIAFLLQNQMSNIVDIKIEPRIVPHPDPEAQKFIASLTPPAIQLSPPPAPSRELRWIRREGERPMPVQGSPDIPAQPGIALSVERVVLDKPGATAMLKGSFRLPVLKREIVPLPEKLKEGDLPTQPDYGLPRPSAVFPINIVILGSGTANVTMLRLNVPTYDEGLAGENAVGTGHFAIDLLASPNIRNNARTFSIYAFCGEFFNGPVLIATVTEDMIPKPIV